MEPVSRDVPGLKFSWKLEAYHQTQSLCFLTGSRFVPGRLLYTKPTGQANLAIYLGALVLRHYGGVHWVIAVAALSTVT